MDKVIIILSFTLWQDHLEFGIVFLHHHAKASTA